MSHLDDGVSTRLSPGPRPDPEDGVSDRDAVLSAEGVEQSHRDTEQGHAEGATTSTAPQPPHQADPVHCRPVDLWHKNRFCYLRRVQLPKVNEAS